MQNLIKQIQKFKIMKGIESTNNKGKKLIIN